LVESSIKCFYKILNDLNQRIADTSYTWQMFTIQNKYIMIVHHTNNIVLTMFLLDKTVKGMYQMSSGLKPQRSLSNVYNYHGFGRVLYNFDMIDHSKQILNSKRTT